MADVVFMLTARVYNTIPKAIVNFGHGNHFCGNLPFYVHSKPVNQFSVTSMAMIIPIQKERNPAKPKWHAWKTLLSPPQFTMK